MNDDRKKVLTLRNCVIRTIESDPKRPNYYRFIGKYGHILFTIDKDSLFDGNGNYFEDDTQ